MYDEKTEALISAALEDGELSEKEKQILFKHAVKQGIDLDEFEMVLNARLLKLKKRSTLQSKEQESSFTQTVAIPQPTTTKSVKYGDVRKCPACGTMVASFQTHCPDCGHEIVGMKQQGQLKNFLTCC